MDCIIIKNLNSACATHHGCDAGNGLDAESASLLTRALEVSNVLKMLDISCAYAQCARAYVCAHVCDG